MKVTPLEDWIVSKSGIMERSINALEEYQRAKIKETLHYVKEHSRFYGNRFEQINENKIDSLEDLKKIPFTYPEDIRENGLELLCIPQKDITRIVTLSSSGTSGKEKRIYFSEQDLELTVDFFQVGMSCLTDETDRVLVLLPGNSYGSIGDLLYKGLERAKVKCVKHGVVSDPEETARSIIENQITCLVGIPMQVLYLSRLKSDLFKNQIKKVLLSADYVPEVLIRELTDRFGCQVFTHYGMSEMGYGGGVECQALNGYHMRDADFYFEIVDPNTGEPLEDGQSGEVVFTTLTRQAMPLVRYRTGDLGSFSREDCTCGTFLRTMTRISGRKENMIQISDDAFLTLRELDEEVLGFTEVMDYKAFMTKEGILRIEIATENKEIIPKIDLAVKQYLIGKLGHQVEIAVAAKSDSKPEKIINSMVKRTIYDERKR